MFISLLVKLTTSFKMATKEEVLVAEHFAMNACDQLVAQQTIVCLKIISKNFWKDVKA